MTTASPTEGRGITLTEVSRGEDFEIISHPGRIIAPDGNLSRSTDDLAVGAKEPRGLAQVVRSVPQPIHWSRTL